MAGTNTFLFIAHISTVFKKIHRKARMWDKFLSRNVQPYFSNYTKTIFADIATTRVNWFTTKDTSKELDSLPPIIGRFTTRSGQTFLS